MRDLWAHKDLGVFSQNFAVTNLASHATALLKTVTAMLERANPSHSFAALVFPLALVTGRRQAELLRAGIISVVQGV